MLVKKHIKQLPLFKNLFSFVKRVDRYNQYRSEFALLKQQQNAGKRFILDWKDRYPCLNDKTKTTSFDPHYMYHPAWAARIVAEIQPKFHVDISSTLRFSTIASAFVPIKFYDYRPADIQLEGLTCGYSDLTNLKMADNSIRSLSCMHVVEHIGLGRYGDALDSNGDLAAIRELKRVLARPGHLLFVVPVGKPKIMFNAHRIYSYDQIRSYFSDFELRQFALVDDKGKFIINADPSYANKQKYGCGCWWFEKKKK